MRVNDQFYFICFYPSLCFMNILYSQINCSFILMHPVEFSQNFPAAQMCYEEKINANFLIIQCKQSNIESR